MLLKSEPLPLVHMVENPLFKALASEEPLASLRVNPEEFQHRKNAKDDCEGLASKQADAVKAMNCPLAIVSVHGPPGTGKPTCIGMAMLNRATPTREGSIPGT